MSEPRILTPTDRATIREMYRLTSQVDVLALLDTCDAMANVIRRLLVGDWPVESADGSPARWRYDDVEVSPAEAAVLDTTRQDPT